MIKKFIPFLALFILSSCVPTKSLIYLQGEPVTTTEIKRTNNIPYKLQVGDVISIDLKSINQDLVSMFQSSVENSSNNGSGANNNQNSNRLLGYSIDSHGNVRLPYIGKINVLGYTTVEVRKKLENELGKMFKNKDDLFITVELSGFKYTILGEVGDGGARTSYQKNLHLIDAIAGSGGISVVGDRKNIEIIRSSIAGRKKYYIDLTTMSAFNSEVFYIKPNDIIVVHPLPQKYWGGGTNVLQAMSTIVTAISLVTSLIIIAKNL